jgi:hypothetical protein
MNESKADITGSITFGLVFIAIGLMALLHEFDVYTFSWRHVLPVVLIVAGVAVVISTQIKPDSSRTQ